MTVVSVMVVCDDVVWLVVAVVVVVAVPAAPPVPGGDVVGAGLGLAVAAAAVCPTSVMPPGLAAVARPIRVSPTNAMAAAPARTLML